MRKTLSSVVARALCSGPPPGMRAGSHQQSRAGAARR
eukprot:CAMPEP_0195056594 /NCGR_PEP_ID=MMETSP0448-20130528/4919_1 /TAXON_ID=66468 /ORGANISM="Heterocapsa triquestra, Strain CCMP 448" /LENGTH=36 /DNA_ID= /DNA_START= /DNA_END= /DNA_ORIENTATION=